MTAISGVMCIVRTIHKSIFSSSASNITQVDGTISLTITCIGICCGICELIFHITFCVFLCIIVYNAPINVKPYYTPPGVHKGKVGIWQYKIWNPHPLGHTLLSNAPASLAYAMGFDNFDFLRMSKLYPWGNWSASNLPALPHYTPGGV